MSHLILVRHGESELNVVNRTRRVFCGQFETPLTEHGREQARSAGRTIASRPQLHVRWVISSLHERSRETLALIVEQLPQAVEVLDGHAALNERSLGQFEGRHEEEVFAQHPHYRDDSAYSSFQNHFVQKALDGENLADVTERAWPCIESLVAERAGDLLVVSHFNTIRCILGRALRLPQQAVLDLRVPNAIPIVLRQRSLGGYELVDGIVVRQ
jgi:2,3-bisphosphoglycerate-dependent phosphoglycerate mutase